MQLTFQATRARETTDPIYMNSYNQFEIVSDTLVLCYGGFMGRSLLSPDVFIWLDIIQLRITRAELIAAKKLADVVLSSIDQRVFAEASNQSSANNKFLTFLGFTLVDKLADRNVYEWIKK